MRKLDQIETNACRVLKREGSLHISNFEGPVSANLRAILDGLVKKKRAIAEPNDDGVRYSLTALGEADAA